jgi:hypothetical protein
MIEISASENITMHFQILTEIQHVEIIATSSSIRILKWALPTTQYIHNATNFKSLDNYF